MMISIILPPVSRFLFQAKYLSRSARLRCSCSCAVWSPLRKKMISAGQYLSSSWIRMAAESSAPRASRTEIFPRSGKLISNQRQRGTAASSVRVKSAWPKSAPIISLAGILAEPVKRKRGGRCWRNNCLSGVSSPRTAFWILEGNLPARRSSRSTTCRSDGGFTDELVFRFSDLAACDTSAVENTLSNANVPPYRDSRLLILNRKSKIFLFFHESKYQNSLSGGKRSTRLVHGRCGGFEIRSPRASARLRRDGCGALWV